MLASYLPPDILDYTIDLLHNEPETLKQCCLVSKSWVPRTRKNLFADIKFRSASNLESWKNTFPDVTNSPARRAHTLFVGCPRLVVAADAEEGGWIQAFSSIRHLELGNDNQYLRAAHASLSPFYGFSPALKSLRICPIVLPFPQVFDLILSFPLLEDLALEGRDESRFNDHDPHGPQIVVPSTSPVFTGTLDFRILEGAGNAVRQMLALPNGLHFRSLVFSCGHVEDVGLITELVARCSHTLKSLDITYTFYRTSICTWSAPITQFCHSVGLDSASFDLPKATKLCDVCFRPETEGVEWIDMALKTITPEHRDLGRISIYLPPRLTFWNIGVDIRLSFGEETSRGWSDLDHLLVQFWEAYSIRPRVGCVRKREKGQNAEYCIGRLLPETTKRGIVDLV